MKVSKKSMVSGITRERELDITQAQYDRWQGGAIVQDAFPHLNVDDREFLMTGITPEEWDATFGGVDYE